MSSKDVTDGSESDAPHLIIALARDFVLPVSIMLALDWLVVVPMTGSGAISLLWGVILVIVPKLLLMPWAGARLLRLAEQHYRRFALGGTKLVLLASLLVALLAVVLSAIESIQAMVFQQHEQARPDQTREATYHFTFDRAGGRYVIEGDIDFGITRDFREFLSRNPGGHLLLLNSRGGSIYEGRGLYQVATTHGLATRVEDTCASACILAYLGGIHRTLSADARLGFHQYAVDHRHLNQAIPFYDPAREQARDLEIMRGIGIEPEFLERAFQRPHDDIWYPDHPELLRAGVVHQAD